MPINESEGELGKRSATDGAIAIRRATIGDLAGVVASASRLFLADAGVHDLLTVTEWPVLHGSSYYRAAIESDDAVVIVAVSEQSIIGHALLRLSPAAPTRRLPVGVIESVEVQPDRRCQGVGGLLLRSIRALAGDAGLARLQVTAYVANHPANRLYRSLEFIDVSTVYFLDVPVSERPSSHETS